MGGHDVAIANRRESDGGKVQGGFEVGEDVEHSVWRHGTMRNDTGRFLILAHENLNKINDSNTPSGPAIALTY